MKEFESQKFAPSASVVNVNKRPPEDEAVAGKKQKSIFSQKRLKGKKDEEVNKRFQIPEVEGDHNSSEFRVLTEIVEKNVSGQVGVTQPTPPDASAVSKHFPDVMKLVDISTSKDNENKKSLFAKQFQQMKKDIQTNVSNSGDSAEHGTGKNLNISSFGSSSRILTGAGLERSEDIASLHEDNLQKLKQMTEEQILEEKEKLIKTLDPSLLSFLNNRRKPSAVEQPARPAVEEGQSSDIKEVTMDRKEMMLDSKDSEVLPSSVSGLENYPGMSRVEAEKVAWQGELPPLQPGQLAGLSARFGFDGSLLAADREVPVTAGLHHHGEEPERAGYSLEEMMILCRSTNSRQRQLGLELLEAVLGRWWTGELDLCLEQNLVREVVAAGLVQVVRLSLDSSEAGLVVAGLRTLVGLLCCREEERLLDWLVDITQPSLAPVLDLGQEEEERKVEELTDQQLVEQDVVLGLLRMDLLDRLHYVLTVLELKEKVMVSGMLGVLIRLARHSEAVCETLSLHPVVASLVQLQPRHPLTVKLTRLLVTGCPRLAPDLLTRLHLESGLCRLLAGEAGESLYSTQASVEAHRLWTVLLSQGLTNNLWASLHSVMMERLVLLYNTDQLNHPSSVAAWLVLAAGFVMEAETEVGRGLGEILENCLVKWLAQLGPLTEEANPTFSQLVSVTCRTLSRHCTARTETALTVFLLSPHYRGCLARLGPSCPFLTRLLPPRRHPACLPSAGLVLEGGHPHPLLTPQSPDILLSGVLGLAQLLALKVEPSTAEPVRQFLARLAGSSPRLGCHLLSRTSSLLLHSLLSVYARSGLLPPGLSLSAALRLSTLVQWRDLQLLRSLFTDFLFNSSVLTKLPPPSVIPPLATPSGKPPPADRIIRTSLTSLSSLETTYSRLLLPARPPAATQPGPILPSDWPYFPLISLYNSSQSPGQRPPVCPEELEAVLAWVSLLPANLSPTATLLRLMTALLCPGTVFLLPQVSSLLHHNLGCLLSSQRALDLAEEVPGVTSNTDLYQQLLEQFISESYGDRVFSLFLVVPCTMTQPLAFR